MAATAIALCPKLGRFRVSTAIVTPSMVPGNVAGMSLVLVDSPIPHVRVITLNRPERLNAMSIDLVIELYDALEDTAADNDCYVVVLTGSGRGFCSGLDLKDYGIIPNIDGLQRRAHRAALDALLLAVWCRPSVGCPNP